MLHLEVRKRSGGAEVHRINGGAVTVGASSGNEVVVRARGVAGRHVRISEREDGYQLDLYKGAEAVSVNGQEFQGGAISPGDRIRIGEATITVLGTRPAARPEAEEGDRAPHAARATEVPVMPATEVEYRAMRLAAYRLCRAGRSPEELATDLTDFLDRELPPSEWAVGELTAGGFRALASTFRETPALPPRLLEEARGGERLARVESVTGVLTLVPEPERETDCLAILVRESPRLAARAVLFLEELAAVAGLALKARFSNREDVAPPAQPAAASLAPPALPISEAESALRQTDDLKKIVETVEHEVIDRAMRRVQGNQSRGSQVLNISRGSLIAKLKEYGIPDYRYLRRERGKRG